MYCTYRSLAIAIALMSSPAFAQTFSTIYDLGPVVPYAKLTIGRRGDLLGTLAFGGLNSAGAVYALIPPSSPGGLWSETFLSSFSPGVGSSQIPLGSVVFNRAGHIYSTTCKGGPLGNGTVFQLTPPSPGSTSWTETDIYSFAGTSDGRCPQTGLTIDPAGDLYGTALSTAFELRPPASTGEAWSFTLLHTFGTGSDGVNPESALLLEKEGRLYGTTNYGGTFGLGTVYELQRTGPATWQETILYNFGTASTDGNTPNGALISGAHGELYGTTELGGYYMGGTAFELKPPSGSGTAWRESVLYNFGAAGDGANPYGGLASGKNGVLYGTTYEGGAAGLFGTVFQLTPPSIFGGVWQETILHSFENAGDGANPQPGVVVGKGDVLFGVSNSTAFEVVP